MFSSWRMRYGDILMRYRGMIFKCGGGLAAAIPVALGGHSLYNAYVLPLVTYDVSGRWCVEHVIAQATHTPYVGMKLQFQFDLKQKDKEITGVGRKLLVNGEPPPSLEISWLEIRSGALSGDRVMLAFTETSDANRNRRTVNGTIDWKVKDKNTLVGTFDTSGASAKGQSDAHRC